MRDFDLTPVVGGIAVLGLLVAGVALAHLDDKDTSARAMRVLMDEGYTNVQIVDVSYNLNAHNAAYNSFQQGGSSNSSTYMPVFNLTGCGNDDSSTTAAIATNPQGHRVNLLVCCTAFSNSCAVRHPNRCSSLDSR